MVEAPGRIEAEAISSGCRNRLVDGFQRLSNPFRLVGIGDADAPGASIRACAENTAFAHVDEAAVDSVSAQDRYNPIGRVTLCDAIQRQPHPLACEGDP